MHAIDMHAQVRLVMDRVLPKPRLPRGWPCLGDAKHESLLDVLTQPGKVRADILHPDNRVQVIR